MNAFRKSYIFANAYIRFSAVFACDSWPILVLFHLEPIFSSQHDYQHFYNKLHVSYLSSGCHFHS